MTSSTATAEALDLFGKITDACAAILATNSDWGLSGVRETQYSVDLLVDAASARRCISSRRVLPVVCALQGNRIG